MAMLPESYRRLLTAFVDGELAARDCRRAEKLLSQSAAARTFLASLRDDVQQLRNLKAPTLENDLWPIIEPNLLSRRGAPGRRRRPNETSVYFSPWIGLAAAAVVLLAVAAASYRYFQLSVDQKPEQARLSAVPKPVVTAPEPTVIDDPKAVEPPETELAAVPPSNEAPALDPQPTTEPDAVVVTPKPEETQVFTAPSMELFKPERVEVNLPVILPLRDLEVDAGRDRLLAELGKDVGFRVELPCRNASRAFERIQSTLKDQSVGLVIDQAAQNRLRQPVWKTNYVIYLEDFTPRELVQLLDNASKLDRKSKPSETQLGDAVVMRLSRGSRKELSDLLGVDPTSVAPRQSGPLGTDPHKELSEKTAAEVAAALASKTGQSASPTKTTPKPIERQALAVAYNPVRPRSNSPDVKHFLDLRRPARPATLHVVIVLRGV